MHRFLALLTALRMALGAAACGLAVAAFAQPEPLHGLTLTDHRNQRVDAALLRGRPTLLHFVFTTCSTVCPTQVVELARVHQALPDDVRSRVRWLSVTVDPLQDTSASLAAFAQRQGADRPGWHFVTGAPKQVHLLLDRMQTLDARNPRPDSHRTSLYLYDAQGRLLQRYAGAPLDRPRLVAELTQITRNPPAP